MKRLSKSLFLLSFLFSIALLSNAQKNSKLVTISGKLGQKASYTQIYLDTLGGQNPWIYSSAPIAEDGSFELTASVNIPDIYRLRLDDKNFVMIILSPGEKVLISTKNSQLGVDANITGSPHTQILYNALNSNQVFENKRDSLNRKYGESQSNPELSAAIIKSFQQNDSLMKLNLVQQMEKNPASLAWLFFQDKLDMANDFPIIDKTEVAIYKAFPENEFVKQYHQQIEKERLTAIGSMAPEIELPNVDGKLVKLSSLKGKVVLIDFWASWCGPCRKENPKVVKLYNEFKDQGFEVFSVSLDKDRDPWIKAIEKDGLIWKNHVSDLKYWKCAGALTYGVFAIPYTVLIDKKGRIVAKKLSGEELEKKVKQLLSK